MNLGLTWTNPAPLPACGYNILYRQQGYPIYSTATTSGTTSGSTSVTIPVLAPANYEGVIQSNCCSGNNSPGQPFGINSYLGFGLQIIPEPGQNSYYKAIISSVYGNPYATYISGNFLLTTTSGATSGTTTVNFTNLIYPAASINTSATIAISLPTANTYSISNIVVTAVTPQFDYGGGLQQFDALLTPEYFGFYFGTKAPWNGSPLSHASFVLSNFQVTQQDVNNNALVGNLAISWIQGSLFSGGTGIYDNVTLAVTDPATSVVGAVSFPQSPLGLRNNTITLTRTNSSYPLTSSTLFTITATWANGSTINTTTFYLPPATL
jgi:hypothetical protein